MHGHQISCIQKRNCLILRHVADIFCLPEGICPYCIVCATFRVGEGPCTVDLGQWDEVSSLAVFSNPLQNNSLFDVRIYAPEYPSWGGGTHRSAPHPPLILGQRNKEFTYITTSHLRAPNIPSSPCVSSELVSIMSVEKVVPLTSDMSTRSAISVRTMNSGSSSQSNAVLFTPSPINDSKIQ